MNNLQGFQRFPEGQVPLCEIDGRVQYASSEFTTISTFTNTVDRHPKIHITRDMLHPCKTLEESRALFVSGDKSYVDHLIEVYYEHGMTEMLESLTNYKGLAVSIIAKVLLNVTRKINRIKSLLNPSTKEPNDVVIERYAQTRNWSQSSVSCIAWHPVFMKIAVASCDDTVRIFGADNNGFIPILKCKQQRNVTCLAWRTMSNSDIAVGCENGIIVWNVDPNSVMARPSMNSAIILTRIDHKPVVSIAWSPRGDILASAAAGDSKIMLWDPELDQTSQLKRAGTVGYTLLKWSDSGERLFSATTSYIFRVWDCKSRKAEKWNVALGRVQAATWSGDGQNLIFSTNEEPILYGLTFGPADVFTSDIDNSPNEAVPLYDVSKIDVNGTSIGGVVQSLEWDPKGNHLAVLFQDTNGVVVFSVVTKPVFQLFPGIVIVGNPEEVPNAIAFQPHYEFGACLTIGWSSGRVQHFPIIYTDFCTGVTASPPPSHINSISYNSPQKLLF